MWSRALRRSRCGSACVVPSYRNARKQIPVTLGLVKPDQSLAGRVIGVRLIDRAKVAVRDIDGADGQQYPQRDGEQRRNDKFQSNHFKGHRQILALTYPKPDDHFPLSRETLTSPFIGLWISWSGMHHPPMMPPIWWVANLPHVAAVRPRASHEGHVGSSSVTTGRRRAASRLPGATRLSPRIMPTAGLAMPRGYSFGLVRPDVCRPETFARRAAQLRRFDQS
jgi:hypothetical protein